MDTLVHNLILEHDPLGTAQSFTLTKSELEAFQRAAYNTGYEAGLNADVY